MPEVHDAPRNHVEFFAEAVLNKRKTREMGRPVHDEREFVRIKFPGDKHRVLVAPAGEYHRRDAEGNKICYKDEYPKHYEMFKAGRTFIGDGTPLSELPFLTEAKRADLRALNIHTAEDLAGLEGTPLTRVGIGARALKDQAAAYIAKAGGSADVTRLAAENAGLKTQMEQMQAQMAELMQRTAPVASGVSGEIGVSEEPPNYADWADEDLKAYIARHTGARPRGNPSHETLVAMAESITEG
jgi:hypothetical protein